MSDRDLSDGTPTSDLPVQMSTATQAAMALRDIDRLERAVKELRADADRRFAAGADSFAQIRAEIGRVRDAMDGKVSSRQAAVTATIAEAEDRFDVKLKAVAESVADLANEVAPRATTTRLAGWIAAVVFGLGAPIASYLLSSARAPDRSEVRELETRLRVLEMRVTTIDARLGARGAAP